MSIRTIPRPADANRTIAIVTGSRADFGLLRPVIAAVDAHPKLTARVVATGAHLVGAAPTITEVRDAVTVAHEFPMQETDAPDRFDDSAAVARGIAGMTAWLRDEPIDVVLVLGDRIEAFAAAAAAAIGGVRVAHVHGGDRAEGIADEAMRHAISKLAHLHLAATPRSTERLVAMGEDPLRTHLVGSPAIDGLADIPPLDDAAYAELGAPEILVLLHPTGDRHELEVDRARMLLGTCARDARVLALHPNHDPGRDGILDALVERSDITVRAHLPRETFIGLLQRVRMIAGNSSAALIECAALRVRAVNVGSRQAGREKPPNVINCPEWHDIAINRAVDRGLMEPVLPFRHPYGDGHAGARIAEVLATFDPDNHALAKRNTY